jgi:hypothetical protein
MATMEKTVGTPTDVRVVNGAASAAVLAAGIGTFAMGLVAVLHEAGLYSAPSFYRPTGGLSGRTTLAVLAWVIAWGLVHRAWSRRTVDARRVFTLTLALIVLGLVGTFPPFWGLFASH